MIANILLLFSLSLTLAFSIRHRRKALDRSTVLIRIPESITVTQSVARAISKTIAQNAPETGGMIGGDLAAGDVTRYEFDRKSRTTSVTYMPDTSSLGKTAEAWNRRGVDFVGFIHSHPGSLDAPSQGDIRYAERILRANPELPYLLLMILVFNSRKSAKVRSYVVTLENDAAEVTLLPTYVETERSSAAGQRANKPNSSPQKKQRPTKRKNGRRKFPKQFRRIESAVDLGRLENCRVIVGGVGGASQLVLDLARSGVREIVVIDPDIVEEQNLSSQSYFLSDVGKPKVAAIGNQLRDISSQLAVTQSQQRVEEISVEAFRELAFEPMGSGGVPTETLIIASTDSFSAQSYLTVIAQKMGLPLIAGQLYEKGEAGEVAFAVPGQTDTCLRCRLQTRYRAYENGYTSVVTSDGALVGATRRLGALEFYIAMAILHHGTTHPQWGDLLVQISDRNLAQVRMSPTALTYLQPQAADELESFRFTDDTFWLPSDIGTNRKCQHAQTRHGD